MYAEFQAGNQIDHDIDFSKVDFVEMYNNTADRWQMHNLVPGGHPAHAFPEKQALRASVHQWYGCKGHSCL